MQLKGNSCAFVALAASLAFMGCSSDSGGPNFSGTGGTAGGAGGGTGATAGTAGASGNTGTGGTAGVGGNVGTGGTVAGCSPVLCPDSAEGTQYNCGDCVDNDGDGLADDKDPECLGPCDDTEGPVLLTGTPGETGSQCTADCYFDRGNGSSGGECQWHRTCDELNPKLGCTWPPSQNVEENICSQELQGCEDGTCRLLTPNGCDCFGCCDLGAGYVYLGSLLDEPGPKVGSCTFADLANPDLCRPCTPQSDCLNECGRCEICLGRSIEDIPEDCFTGTGGAGGMAGAGGMGGSGDNLRCDPGVQPCGLPGDEPCEAGGFCLTGCCIIVQ